MKYLILATISATLLFAQGAQAKTVFLKGGSPEGASWSCMLRYDFEEKGNEAILTNVQRIHKDETFSAKLTKKRTLGILSAYYEGASNENLTYNSKLALYLKGGDLSLPRAFTFGLHYPAAGETHWDVGLFSRYEECANVTAISEEEFRKIQDKFEQDSRPDLRQEPREQSSAE